MGSVSLKIGDGTARFKKATFCSSSANILMLVSVVTTNLFALYAFTYSPTAHGNFSLISDHVSLILREIHSSQKKLSLMETSLLGYDTIDLSRPNLATELKLYLQPQQLPLGRDSKTGITEMVSSVGHSCSKSADLLSQYMTYTVSGPCPDDSGLAQKLILRGCEPLPRRRCLAKTVPKVGLWKPVSDKIVSWSGIGCKSFECLNKKKLCFDLGNGNEKQKFVKGKGNADFPIDQVLGMVRRGGMRIGLDVGGGCGTFAATMAERNVTVITVTLNEEAPFIAARGLFPLYMSLDHRFPFYDNVFDLIHATSVLVSDVGEKVEFLMFDIDRVLRVGGLLWLDNIECGNDEGKRVISRLVDRFGYKKLKWVVGEKKGGSVHLSALVQKPVRI